MDIEIRAPFLEKFASGPWSRFLLDYEAYHARGGKKRLTSLISSTAFRTICIRYPNWREMSEEEFVTTVSSFFAPKTSIEAFERFKKIIMPTRSASIDATLAYIFEYNREEVTCATCLPPAKMLRKQFIAGLRPLRLGERVTFRQPSDIAEAKAYAIEETETLLRMTREVALATPMPSSQHGTSVNASDGTSKATVRRSDKLQASATAVRVERSEGAMKTSAKPIVCHECGEPGHKRPDCPRRTSTASWKRTTTRLQRVDGAADAPSAQAKMLTTAKYVEPEDSVPRLPVSLMAPDGTEFAASALVDTGASLCFISPELYEKLLTAGVAVRRNPREVIVANGSVSRTKWEVTCLMKVVGAGGRRVQAQVVLNVMHTGEDVLLGYPYLSSSGLLSLVAQPFVPTAAHGAHDVSSFMTSADDEPAWADDEPIYAVDASATVDDPPESIESNASAAVSAEAGDALSLAINNLMTEFSSVFDERLPEAGALVNPMPIDLMPGLSPKALPPRRVSPAIRAVIQEETQSLLSQGIIRPSSSPFSSPVVVVKKGDGTYRMCVDYRCVNACTVDLKYPMQNTKVLLERMAGKTVFGTLDLRSGFHQVPVNDEAVPLTAFATPDGLYEYVRVPFGLKNAPPFFQRTMSGVLSGLAGNICEVFVDDIIVYGQNDEEFLHNLRLVLERLRSHQLRVKASKCKLGLREVEYLGHIVNGSGIKLSSKRKQGLLDMQQPINTSQVRSFMGLANYFRSFIPNFAALTKPLTSLCSTRVRFEWSPASQNAFDCVKQAVLDAPMLHHLDYTAPIILRTDASTVGIGGVLLQRVDGTERPVCFVSKAFNDAESRWSTIEQEAYSIYYCVLALSHHLLGHHFTVETDHRNLLYLDRATSPKLIRWRLRLQEYDFAVTHIAGRHNVVADALSRCFAVAKPDRLAHTQEIERVHNSVAGHRGVNLTVQMLKSAGIEWNSMSSDVSAFVQSCPTCQKVRLRQGKVVVERKTTEASEPFSIVAIDTVGPLPVDADGNKYIIAVIDCFSRFVELYAVPSASAKDAAKALLNVFGRYGAPKTIRSDQGSQYTARVITALLSLVGSQRQLTLAYRPEANGIVERANGEITRHLRALVMDHRILDRWSIALPLVQRILNVTAHSALGTAPARILFGDAVQLDRAVLLPHREGGSVVVDDYIRQLTSAQSAIVSASKEHQDQVVQERIKKSPDNPTKFKVGDHVLISYPQRAPNKLAPKWRGPMVVQRIKGSTYSCKDLTTGKLIPFHVTRLKRYNMQQTDNALDVAAVDKDEWEVEEIVDHRGPPDGYPRKELEFLVRWKGYEPCDDSWLPYAEVNELQALDEYAVHHPELGL